MAGFSIVTTLFQTIDDVLESMVTSNVSTIIELATPVVAILLCCKFMTQGFFMMLNPNGGEPLSEILTSFFKCLIILSFATAGGLYQTDLISLAQNLPDTMATKLQGLNHTSYTGIAGIIDGGVENCIDAIKTEFQSSGISSAGLMSLVIGAILIVPTVLLAGIGAGFIIMAKVLLSVTLSLGPLAIFCLLWRPTKGIFDKWIGMVINYTLVTIIMAIVFGLLMELFTNMITGLNEGAGAYDALSTVLGLCILTAVAVLVLFQVPQLAAAFGSGIHAGIGQGVQAATSSIGGLNPVGAVTKAISHGAKGGSAGGGSSSSGSAGFGGGSQLTGKAHGSRGKAA